MPEERNPQELRINGVTESDAEPFIPFPERFEICERPVVGYRDSPSTAFCFKGLSLLFEYVVKGIADYGNRIGVPTIGGETEFDESLDNYALVNVACVGVMKLEHLVHSFVNEPGLKLVLVGNRTGRDGIHGVTFASEELSGNDEEDRSAVQIPDPFTEKLLIEATLEAVYTGKVRALKDLGGGGLTCAASEVAGKKGFGAVIYADRVPLRERGMSVTEVMISESQERMLFAVKPEDVEEIGRIFDKYELE